MRNWLSANKYSAAVLTFGAAVVIAIFAEISTEAIVSVGSRTLHFERFAAPKSR